MAHLLYCERVRLDANRVLRRIHVEVSAPIQSIASVKQTQALPTCKEPSLPVFERALKIIQDHVKRALFQEHGKIKERFPCKLETQNHPDKTGCILVTMTIVITLHPVG